MAELVVKLGARAYPVVVERDARPRLVARLRELAPSKTVLVTDENVSAIASAVGGAMAEGGFAPARVATFAAGERSKTLATVERLYGAFLEAGLDRRSVVVAVGGGVVGDVAGFAAATWMRGIAVVHVPTTLLAMVDSAVGGKTGVDLAGKNLVGAFHQPSGVFASLDALATLPRREVRGGLGEVLKSAILSGEELFARVERDAAKLVAVDLEALEPVIFGCLALKAGVVSRDEREDGERALLNLGHTLGHALESLAGFSADLIHGEAVAIGTCFAAHLGVRLGLLAAAERDRMIAVARSLGLPVARPGFDAVRALELMKKDKKAVGGKLRLVLPRSIGRVEVVDAVPEHVVRAELDVFSLLSH
jgi:3-dehydroquinate synthase